MAELSEGARDLLGWLCEAEFSQYGECHGKALDELVALGFAEIHSPGQHQTGFIAQDHAGVKGDMYRAVSLTDKGYEALTGKPRVS